MAHRFRHPTADAGADALGAELRELLDAHAGTLAPPLDAHPEAVNFVLTLPELQQRTAWDGDRGAYDHLVAARRLREMASVLAFVPVLGFLWWPAWGGYEASALVPAAVVTVGVVVGTAWAWHTALRREVVRLLGCTELAWTRDAQDERGPTSVWLGVDGVNLRYVNRWYHFAWSRISQVTDTGELVLFDADGLGVAMPYRADPPRVAAMSAGLRARAAGRPTTHHPGRKGDSPLSVQPAAPRR
ncbi:MAG: hypothetical protein LCH96_08450 [Actinobacteria bacterium]|nr:hypothetical protein [Actinomycetota bacterium]